MACPNIKKKTILLQILIILLVVVLILTDFFNFSEIQFSKKMQFHGVVFSQDLINLSASTHISHPVLSCFQLQLRIGVFLKKNPFPCIK
jgi:hypothetical protein